jgi:hypothetical protein
MEPQISQITQMKKDKLIILLFVGILAAGCSGIRPGCGGNEVVCDLYQTGMTENNTKKIVFVGSEANFGPIRVEISEDQKVQDVWSILHRCCPGGIHYSCGMMAVEFYNSMDGMKPNAKLTIWCGNDDGIVLVNESNRQMYDGKTMRVRDMYKCPGLEKYVMAELEKEYKTTNQQGMQ